MREELNNLGLGNFWLNQGLTNVMPSASVFKCTIKQRLHDQFIQGWFEEINNNEFYYNYRMFKLHFEFEKYLHVLPTNLAISVLKFRTLNHRMPVQRGRYFNIPRHERVCQKCNSGDLGDEFHYLFLCSHFCNSRRDLLKSYYYKYPNAIKFQELLSSNKKSELLKLVSLMKLIIKQM